MDIPKSFVILAQTYPGYICDVHSIDIHRIVRISEGTRGWIGKERNSNRRVYIRQYGTEEELKGNTLHRFMTEVHTLARLNHRFIDPLLGVMLSNPYSIVTTHYKNGYLYDYLRSKEQSFNPTHMTAICLCIAQAMRYLHARKIIFRNLNSRTIALDSNGLPILTQFEKCCFGRMMRNKTGCIDYAAPELLKGTDYDTRVDVYAFGVLLYEMFERKDPFGDMPGDKIQNDVINMRKRPLFSSNTPQIVQQYIEKLWSQEPHKRPTFNEIYSDFANNRIEFPGTVQMDIQTLVGIIETKEAKRRGVEPQAPHWQCDFNEVIKKLRAQQNPQEVPSILEDEKMETSATLARFERSLLNDTLEMYNDSAKIGNIQTKSVTPDMITNVQDLDFDKNWRWIALNEARKDYLEKEFAILRKHFEEGKISEKSIMVVVKQLNVLITRNPNIMTGYEGFADLVWSIPLQSPAIIHVVMDLMVTIVQLRAEFVTGRGVQLMNFLILYDPDGALAIFQYYSVHYNPISCPIDVLLLFLEKANVYESRPSSCVYIAIMFKVILRHRPILAEHPEFREMLVHFSESSNTDVAENAYNAISILMDSSFVFNYERIAEQLRKPPNRPFIYRLLTRLEEMPLNETLASTLIELATEDPQAITPLLCFADASTEHRQVLLKFPRLMGLHLPTIVESYKIVMMLFADDHIRKSMVNFEEFSVFLTHIVESQDPFLLNTIPGILERVHPTNVTFGRLIRAGFIQKYYTLLCATRDINLLNAGLLVTLILAPLEWTPDFDSFVPVMARMMLWAPEFIGRIMMALLVLSEYEDCVRKMHEVDIAIDQTRRIGLLSYLQEYIPKMQNYQQSGLKPYVDQLVTKMRNSRVKQPRYAM